MLVRIKSSQACAASTVAINATSGKLAWHYQHAPGESLDLDKVYERVLVDIGRRVVFTIGKPGILWKLDRTSGAFLGHKDRLGTSVQGYQVSFAINGNRYIAVTTGLGGGSPRQVRRTIARDVRHPQTGNALYSV